MLMKRLLAFFAIATFGITTLSAENVETVYSPDGKVKLFSTACWRNSFSPYQRYKIFNTLAISSLGKN